MEVRPRKSLGLFNEWMTCRVKEEAPDRKKKIGNQFADLFWLSRGGAGANRDKDNRDKGQKGV